MQHTFPSMTQGGGLDAQRTKWRLNPPRYLFLYTIISFFLGGDKLLKPNLHILNHVDSHSVGGGGGGNVM